LAIAAISKKRRERIMVKKTILVAVLLAAGLAVVQAQNTAPENKDASYAAFRRGYSAQRGGDYDTAIAEFTEAIRLDPNFTAAYFDRGYSYCKKGDWDRAIADFEAALRLMPDRDSIRETLENARRQQAPTSLMFEWR
jgi:tetratricopeptide (TPR) repeat protein